MPLRTNTVWGLVVIYALTFFFSNFGPNTTTFIIPGEAFPTRYVTVNPVLRTILCWDMAVSSACQE